MLDRLRFILWNNLFDKGPPKVHDIHDIYMLLDATLPEETTDCCVANTIVNCYYWSFEVANVVADGRFRKKAMIMWLKGMWIKDIS